MGAGRTEQRATKNIETGFKGRWLSTPPCALGVFMGVRPRFHVFFPVTLGGNDEQFHPKSSLLAGAFCPRHGYALLPMFLVCVGIIPFSYKLCFCKDYFA